MGEEVSDREVITALLTGRGDKYESMIESFDSLDDYTLQQVKVKLTSREERMKQAKAVSDAKARRSGNGPPEAGFGTEAQQTTTGQHAFYAQNNRKRKGGSEGGKGQGGQQKRHRRNIQCWNCEKWGHYERAVPQRYFLVDHV
ncbi:hypothetical protein PHMEG_00033894 [Phytophthora megakarya]|uniref:CCHC-type domain-containing protein n=1 Tax=Phytophthora megakarya TaxID=4795 RepID=A0A225UST0_9STRA|nr:hypothetical protein PHMEG_00033894 [Phytophthora megakarya]